MPEENLGNQCTPMLDEDQTIPKTICETILQEHPHELEQSINADINEEPQNPVNDTQPKLPLSGSRVLIAGSSVLKGIDPSKLKDYIDVHVHRGANVLDLYEDIRSMDLSSYNTIIIHVGGNDASSKMNVQQFVDIFQEIINFVRCQNCRAIVSGILPRIQCDVTEYNTILKQMCHYNDVKFISNYESFVYKDDHIAKSFYTTDGIHLNRYGTIKLLANVNKYSGGTPLHSAARYGHLDIVQLLLERADIDPNKETKTIEYISLTKPYDIGDLLFYIFKIPFILPSCPYLT
ncbi:Hypothetical predicted protein [Mytilus galloprovincialis]|uniref:SGNH hydrolase-type esterase domain-containing protein n=1 Tax=Mytilus galloprovincialis TaxID=29158 RepID=A0A8B6HA20_MYTGA|nr:Hypothetical predicted protein [Mytilus galloprovincialis]